jgi:Big-like domain-containing protein
MTHGRSENLVRGLFAVALLLSFGLFGGTCTSNAGRVFNGNNGGDGGDTGGGGENGGGGGVNPPTPPAPPQALFEGALTLTAAPRAVAFGPSDGTTGVDVQSPIVVWFSESLARSSVNLGSLGVRRVEGGGGVNRTLAFYNGDRCAVLVPISPLQADAEYEIFASEGLHDLSGLRFVPPVNGVIASFTTASVTSGLDPQVVGSFPPAGATIVPHNSDVTVVFSKPVSYESAIANIRVEQVDGSGATIGSAALDAPAGAEQGGRVFAYSRTEGADALDLGKRLAVAIDPGVEDTEFNVHTLADPYQGAWQTLSFGPPLSVSTAATPGGEDQALNRALLTAFPLRLDVSGLGLNPGDQLTARIGEVFSGSASAGTASVKRTTVLTAAQSGGSPVVFSFNFESSVAGLSQLRDGSLAVNAFTQRGGARSLVKGLSGIVQDTVPPTLTRFGPPFASSAGTFLTDLPELRPYGIANEAIGVVETSAAGGATVEQTAAEPSANNWFLGAETTGLTDVQRFSLGTTNFELSLVDSAGNPMLETVTGRVGFRGFIGPTASTDAMTVQAIDARSLAPIFGCAIQIEAADGSDFRGEITSLTGQTTFTGLASRDYHVTIQADGYHTATYYGLQSVLVSLPLRPIVGGSQTISPVVSLANANGGELRMASPLLLDADGRGEALAVRDATVPFGFEFGGASVRSDRPGWFAGFFRLSDTDPFSQYALDPRIIVDPYSSSTVSAMPALDMIEVSAVARVDFPLSFPSVAGNEGLVTSAMVTLPGLLGPIPIAAGEDFPVGTGATSSTITVVDAMRQAAADYSAEDFADLDIDLVAQASFTAGAGASARVRDASATGPNIIVWPSNVPGVFSTGVDPQALAGTPLAFRDSIALDGDVGYYAVVIDDGSQQWDLWVPASSRLLGDPPFPTLATSPLDDNIDAVWDMFVEAFHMPAGFGEMGFFFRALERDWAIRARSALRTITS